jgi:starch-binding outer membrane protein, SusD/RagB family
MTHTHSIRRMMAFSSKARSNALSRAYAIAALALAATAAGCKKDSLLQVTDPDILNPGDYTTPAGATPLRVGVIADFSSAFDGSTDSFVTMTGNLADELLASDTFDGRLTINARRSVETNSEMEGVYRAMQRARTSATRTAGVLATTAPTPLANRGEMYMLLAYTEMFLGEAWCPGVPFSSENGTGITYGQPLTTDQMMQAAVAHFDTALSLAETNARVLNGSKIGKGRALMNLGKFAEAAAAVTTGGSVPLNFVLAVSHSSNSTSNGAWSGSTSGASRYRLVSNEGKNGLPFLGQTAAQDPRIDWSTSTRSGFSSQFTAQPNQAKYGQYIDGAVATGAEARLIELEAQLQAGTQASRDAAFAALNTLRTGGAAIGGAKGTALITVAAMTGTAPTTAAAAIDLLYKERAYWLWLTGHRLGDLRRLVRVYKRDSEAVFPTGTLTSPLEGTYGTSTTVTIPFSERNNPNFKGCLDGQ